MVFNYGSTSYFCSASFFRGYDVQLTITPNGKLSLCDLEFTHHSVRQIQLLCRNFKLSILIVVLPFNSTLLFFLFLCWLERVGVFIRLSGMRSTCSASHHNLLIHSTTESPVYWAVFKPSDYEVVNEFWYKHS